MMKFLDILINIKTLYEFYIYEFFVNFKRLFFNKNRPLEKTHVPLETQRIPRELHEKFKVFLEIKIIYTKGENYNEII